MNAGRLRLRLHGPVVLGLVAVLALACSSEKTTTPTSGPDVPNAADAALDLVLGRPAQEIAQCSAGELLDGDANEDLFSFLGDSVLATLAEGEDLSSFYGTWADKSGSPNDGLGVARVSDDPSDGIRLELAGTDSTGAPLSGSLTLENVELTVIEGEDSTEIEAAAEITIVEDGGDSISFSGTLNVTTPTPPAGAVRRGVQGTTITFEGTGNICDLDYELIISWSEATGKLDVSGWYVLDLRVNAHLCVFGFAGDTGSADSLTVDLWVGGASNPLALASVTIDPDATSDCVTGGVFTGGEQRGEIISTGCGTDTLAVFVVTETDTIPLDEIFEDLGDIIPLN